MTLRTATWHLLGTAAILTAASLSGAFAQETPVMQDIGRTTERELSVVLSSSFGTVLISRGESEKVLAIESPIRRKDDARIVLDYAIRNRIGYADVALGEKARDGERPTSIDLGAIDRGKWYVRLTDAVPISLDIELGVGRGDFNLSGLKVKDFTLSTGASDVTLAFDEPNTTVVENINIESGVSKFDARGLGNANFKHLRFEGGLGSYTLDFAGSIRGEVDVDVEVGFGLLTLMIPADIGARILYDKSWTSRLDCDADFRLTADQEYLSENYDAAAGRMNIRVNANFGSVKVRRR